MTVVAAIAGTVGIASYIYTIGVRAAPMRAMTQIALCSNLCAVTLIVIGVCLDSEAHVVLALGFVLVATLTLSRAAVRRRGDPTAR